MSKQYPFPLRGDLESMPPRGWDAPCKPCRATVPAPGADPTGTARPSSWGEGWARAGARSWDQGLGQGCSEHVAGSLLELERNHQRFQEGKIRIRQASERPQTLARPSEVLLTAAQGSLKAKHLPGAMKSIFMLRASKDRAHLPFGVHRREKRKHPLHRVTPRSLMQPSA